MERNSEKKRLSFWVPIFGMVIFLIGCAATVWLYWRITSPYSTFYSQLRPLQGKIMRIEKEDLRGAGITIQSPEAGSHSYMISNEDDLAALADYLNGVRFTGWAASDWRPAAPGGEVSIRLQFNKPVPEPKWENTKQLQIYLYFVFQEEGANVPEDYCILQMDNAKYAVKRKYLEEIVQLWQEGRKTETVPLPQTHPMP